MFIPTPEPVFATSTGFPVLSANVESIALVQTDAPKANTGYGPQLMQDIFLFDNFRHFARERIPERILHAKGAGAHGYFLPTKDLSQYTIAAPFQPENLNKKILATARFSTVNGQAGSADTVRTFRGFAVKLKTEVGNWDWAFINTPVFSLRDPAKLIGLSHAQSRDPRTHIFNHDRSWDSFSSNPETVHELLYVFSDNGIVDGYSNQHGYSVNPFSWVNKDGVVHYVKMQLKAPSIKYLDSKKGAELAGTSPDYNSQALYTAIENQNYPTWTVQIQVMSLEAASYWTQLSGYSVFDATKLWPEAIFPPIDVGKLVLDTNPGNYFAEIEQLAFSPATLIPGIIPSPDPILQTRLFVYPDTQVYRLGVNLQQLPANRPICPIANFQRDGFMAIDNQTGLPNYNSALDPIKTAQYTVVEQNFIGKINSSFSSVLVKRDFTQPRERLAALKPDERERTVQNIVDSLGRVRNLTVTLRQLDVFATIDLTFAQDIAQGMGWTAEQIEQIKPLDLPDN